jgi:hypothetical protein
MLQSLIRKKANQKKFKFFFFFDQKRFDYSLRAYEEFTFSSEQLQKKSSQIEPTSNPAAETETSATPASTSPKDILPAKSVLTEPVPLTVAEQIESLPSLNTSLVANISSLAGTVGTPLVDTGDQEFEIVRAMFVLGQGSLVGSILYQIGLVFERYAFLQEQSEAELDLVSSEIKQYSSEIMTTVLFLLSIISQIPFMKSICEVAISQISPMEAEIKTAPSAMEVVRQMVNVSELLTYVIDRWAETFKKCNQLLFQKSLENSSNIVVAPTTPTTDEIVQLMAKTANSDFIPLEDQKKLSDFSLADLAVLAKDKQFQIFSVEKDCVIKVRFNFKLTHVFQAPSALINEAGIVITPVDNDLENLNNVTTTSDLYFVVIQNDNSISVDEICQHFYKDFFLDVFAKLVSEKLELECIQIQRFWPSKAIGSFDTLMLNEPGLGPSDQQISTKPFILSFTSSFLKSSKNAFTFGLPGVLTKFKKATELKGLKADLHKLTAQLTGYIDFGPTANVRLALVVPTSKSTSPVPFVPITNCSVVGFGSNARKSSKFRSTTKKNVSMEGSS